MADKFIRVRFLADNNITKIEQQQERMLRRQKQYVDMEQRVAQLRNRTGQKDSPLTAATEATKAIDIQAKAINRLQIAFTKFGKSVKDVFSLITYAFKGQKSQLDDFIKTLETAGNGTRFVPKKALDRFASTRQPMLDGIASAAANAAVQRSTQTSGTWGSTIPGVTWGTGQGGGGNRGRGGGGSGGGGPPEPPQDPSDASSGGPPGKSPRPSIMMGALGGIMRTTGLGTLFQYAPQMALGMVAGRALWQYPERIASQMTWESDLRARYAGALGGIGVSALHGDISILAQMQRDFNRGIYEKDPTALGMIKRSMDIGGVGNELETIGLANTGVRGALQYGIRGAKGVISGTLGMTPAVTTAQSIMELPVEQREALAHHLQNRARMDTEFQYVLGRFQSTALDRMQTQRMLGGSGDKGQLGAEGLIRRIEGIGHNLALLDDQIQGAIKSVSGVAGRAGAARMAGSVLGAMSGGMPMEMAAQIAGTSFITGNYGMLGQSLRGAGGDWFTAGIVGGAAAEMTNARYGILSGAGLLNAMQAGRPNAWQAQGRVGAMQQANALMNADPLQKSLNYYNAKRALPNASYYATTTLAETDFQTLVSVVNDPRAKMPEVLDSYGIGRNDVRSYLNQTYRGWATRAITPHSIRGPADRLELTLKADQGFLERIANRQVSEKEARERGFGSLTQLYQAAASYMVTHAGFTYQAASQLFHITSAPSHKGPLGSDRGRGGAAGGVGSGVGKGNGGVGKGNFKGYQQGVSLPGTGYSPLQTPQEKASGLPDLLRPNPIVGVPDMLRPTPVNQNIKATWAKVREKMRRPWSYNDQPTVEWTPLPSWIRTTPDAEYRGDEKKTSERVLVEEVAQEQERSRKRIGEEAEVIKGGSRRIGTTGLGFTQDTAATGWLSVDSALEQLEKAASNARAAFKAQKGQGAPPTTSTQRRQ